MYFDSSFLSSFSYLVVAIFPSITYDNDVVNVAYLYNDGLISIVIHHIDTPIDSTMWTNFFE